MAAQVLRDTFRVLIPNGRLVISDVVNIATLSPDLAAARALICGCVVGRVPASQIEPWLACFRDVRVTVKPERRDLIATWALGRGVENFVASAIVEGIKPTS